MITARPPHTPAQLEAGKRVALTAIAAGYSLADAADVARCYVAFTPTLRGSRS